MEALQQLQAQLAELQATSSMRIKDLEYWNNELVAENQRLSRQLEEAQEEAKAVPRGPLQANRPGSRRASGPEVAAQVRGCWAVAAGGGRGTAALLLWRCLHKQALLRCWHPVDRVAVQLPAALRQRCICQMPLS